MTSRKRTVMICDDERDLLRILQVKLGSKYEVVVVDSGKLCIEKFMELRRNGVKIDILLLDYRLGDVLGDYVACEVHKANGVKTVLMSVYFIEDTLVRELIEKGCIVEKLEKPINLKNLEEKINRLLEA
jgi:response regulator RpfG family c-di-GMP phosphodiesterase